MDESHHGHHGHEDAETTSGEEVVAPSTYADQHDVAGQGMIPERVRPRSPFERISMRILATGGIIGLDVALGAILVANNVHGWIVGLAVGLVSVLLAAVLWSSRQL